jgi:hypothetical protein
MADNRREERNFLH